MKIITPIIIAAILTIIIQANLTRAIIFGNYGSRPDIVLENSDETYYLPLVSESAKGNRAIGNPFLYEWRNQRFLYPALNINVMGFIKQLFGWTIKTTAIVFDYVGVFIIIALTLILFLVIFAWSPFAYIPALLYIFLPRMLDLWTRPVSPQVNFVPLLLFFILYFSRWRFVVREIGLAACVGVMFYTYPYHWTFVLPFLVLSDVWAMYRAHANACRRLYKYALIAALAVPYLENLWAITRLPYYEESMRRIGALASRYPAGFYTHVLIFACLLAYVCVYRFVMKKHGNTFVHSPGLLIGLVVSLIVLNQQLITNMQLEFNSHYLPVILLFAVAMIGALTFTLAQTLPRFKVAIIAVAAIIVLGVSGRSVYAKVSHSPFVVAEHYVAPAEMEVYRWFIDNKISNTVVYASMEINGRLNLYTGNYLYFANAGRLQLVPTAELLDRFLYFDITNKDLTEQPQAHQIQVFGNFYLAKMQKDNVLRKVRAAVAGAPFVPVGPEAYVTYDFTPMTAARQKIDADILRIYLAKYHVAYLVYEVAKRNSIYWDMPGTVVFENGEYIIKKVDQAAGRW